MEKKYTDMSLNNGVKWSFLSNEGIGIKDASITLESDGEAMECLSGAGIISDSPAGDMFGEHRRLTAGNTIYKNKLEATTVFRHYPDRNALLIHVEIKNISDADILLGRCSFLSFGGGTTIHAGANAKEARILCQSGCNLKSTIRLVSADPMKYWKEYRDMFGGNDDVVPFPADRHRSKTMGFIYNPDGQECVNCSFLTFDRANTEVAYSYRESSGICMEAFCDFAGFELKPGMETNTETLCLSVGREYDRLLDDWATMVNTHYKPSFAAKPALGWIGVWQWTNTLLQGVYEEDLLRNIEAMKNRLAGFGIQYIWVSMGNIKDFIPGNWLEENPEHFPHGLKWMIEKLSEQGLKMGFWIAPFWIPDKFTRHFEEQKDQILKNKGQYCREDKRFLFGESGKLPPEERLGFYCRDGSNPEAREYVRHVFDTYYQMGIRYYMIDFLWTGCGTILGHHNYDEYFDRTLIKGPEVYRALLKTIREAAGRDTYILSSSGPTFYNLDYVDAARSAPDCGEGRPVIKGTMDYPATYTIMNWNLLRTCYTNYAMTYFTNKKLYHNDALNMLTVDKPVPLNEARMEAGLFALSGGPIMLGDELDEISEERLSIIKKCLPQNSGHAKVTDLFDTAHPDYPRIFSLKVERDWDEWHVIGVLNLDDGLIRRRLDFGKQGISKGETVEVYDFWDEMYAGSYKGWMDVEVPAHSMKVLRISKKRSHPWLLSTDMHIVQGAVEVMDLCWDSGSMTLHGVCTRPKGERGNVFIIAPTCWIPVDYKGIHVSRVSGRDILIIMKTLVFDEETVSFGISFKYEGNVNDVPGGFLTGDERLF